MHLGSFNSATHHFESIRVLTADEIAEFEKLRPPFTEARDRLALFRMLSRNYSECRRYLNRLLSANFKEDVDISEELNRLILNYLTLAYSIQEHFSVSLKQRFRNDPKKLQEYNDFIDRLSKASWAFAFVLDYRGYVQHAGLAVGRNNRVASDTLVKIEVVADAKTLLSDKRQWERSRLTPEKGEIDLVAVLKEFHIQMLQSYGSFVAKTFFPELQPAAEFFDPLAKEVRQCDPQARMIFCRDPLELKEDGHGRKTGEFKMIMVPNDVFAELGIKVTKLD